LSTLLFALIFASPPFLKVLLLRWFCSAQIGHHVHIGWLSAVMGRRIVLGDRTTIRPCTLIKLSGEVSLGSYSEVSSFNLIYGSSSLTIGDHCYIGPQSLINVEEEVRLGNGSALGPRSMVFTHGSFLPYTEGYWAKLAGVTIGNKVWCAARVFIHPGVEIGDDTFVNAGSVVTQSIPAGSVVEGNPARVIYPMEQVKRKMSPRRVDAALDQVLHDFAEVGLRRELGIQEIKEAAHQLSFQWRRHEYRIIVVPSAGPSDSITAPHARMRQILLLNVPGWSPPPGAMVFDLVNMETPFSSEQIHTALRLFMLRYYGIQFTEKRER
jgi:acetyltransferase-like isoleucine patch superfamily enzyme